MNLALDKIFPRDPPLRDQHAYLREPKRRQLFEDVFLRIGKHIAHIDLEVEFSRNSDGSPLVHAIYSDGSVLHSEKLETMFAAVLAEEL